jgi:hypothetical protein
MGVYVSQLNIQLGIIEADGIYRMQRDYGRALGQDADKYLKPPTPNAMRPKIFYEEALAEIMAGHLPEADPIEGAEEHFKKLTDFMQSDEFGHLGPEHMPLFRAYYKRIAALFIQEQQKAAMLAAAQQFQQGVQKPGTPGPQGAPQSAGAIQAQPPVQGNELVDESLPGAGGGANAGAVH